MGCYCGQRHIRTKIIRGSPPKISASTAFLDTVDAPVKIDGDTLECQDCFRLVHFDCCNIASTEADSVLSFSCKNCKNVAKVGKELRATTPGDIKVSESRIVDAKSVSMKGLASKEKNKAKKEKVRVYEDRRD